VGAVSLAGGAKGDKAFTGFRIATTRSGEIRHESYTVHLSLQYCVEITQGVGVSHIASSVICAMRATEGGFECSRL